MGRYIIKRILITIPMVFVITLLSFMLMQLAPYDAVDAITTPEMKKEEIEMRREEYGLNDSAITQYGRWVKNIMKGDLGYSLLSRTNIKQDLKKRIPATIKLILPAYVTASVLAFFLGLTAGSHRNKKLDKIIDGLASIGIATPSFWFAMILMYVLGYKLQLFPLMGMYTIGGDPTTSDYLRHFFMPYLVLVIAFLPDLTRYVRASTIGELKEDYVTVQSAFGASKREILIKEVGRNVLIPLVTMFGMALPMLVTGAVITETVFCWPGIGPYFVKAIQSMDYPIVMSILLLSGTLTILGNLFADILCVLVDPRIRTEE